MPPKSNRPSSPPRQELRWEHWTAAGLLFGMALIAFVNVLGRCLFHYSLAFTEELTINMFVWLTVLGSGMAFERGAQMGMVSVYNLLPRRLRTAVIWLGALLAAALFAVIDLLLIRTIYFEVTLFRATSPALGIPVWIYYAAVPPCSVAVFRGIWRGARRAAAADVDGEDA